MSSSLPPPPPQIIPSSPSDKKRKKKFTLSTENTLQNGNPQNSKTIGNNDGRVLIIPHLHYGLERIQSNFTIMDKSNELTHSPTLVSFGGTSLIGGIVDAQLMYLDLEPPLQNGGVMNVEFEWKTLGSLDAEHILSIRGSSNVTFQYCRRRQSLLLLCSTNVLMVFEFSLKTLKWKHQNLNADAHIFKIDQTEKYLMNIYQHSSISVRLYNLDDFFEVLDLQNNKSKEMPPLVTIISSPLAKFPHGVIIPFLDRKKLMALNTTSDLYYGVRKPPDLYNIFIDGHRTCNYTRIFPEIGARPSMAGFPNFEIVDDLIIQENSPKKLLISLYNTVQKRTILYVKDVEKCGIDELRYNPMPIELKHHALFETVSFGYLTRKNERRVLIMPGTDLIFIVKLDYFDIHCAFPVMSSFSDRIALSDICCKTIKK